MLGCATMMGGMMWMMMRGNHAKMDAQQPDTANEIAALRAEIATLRSDNVVPIDHVAYQGGQQ